MLCPDWKLDEGRDNMRKIFKDKERLAKNILITIVFRATLSKEEDVSDVFGQRL